LANGNGRHSADAVETFYMRDRDKMMFVPTFVGFCEQQPEIILSKEHDAYEWFSFDEAYEKLLWSEQKRILRHIEENFIKKPPQALNLIS
jgi:dihydroneopterin triphosphate diphosphatase